MNCGQFRQFYSDFIDGLLDEAEEVAFHVHMAECVDCRRFDAALEQGRTALRHMEPPAAGLDFESRLFDRILRLDEIRPEPALRQWSGMAGAVLIVAVVGVVGLNVRSAMRQTPAPFRQGRSESQTNVVAPHFVTDTSHRTAADTLAVSRPAPALEVSNDQMVP